MKTSIIFTITKEELEKIVNKSKNIRDILNNLGISGRGHSYDYLKMRLFYENIDYEHIKNKKINYINQSLDEVLVENSTYVNTQHLKKKLINSGRKENKCEICNQGPFHNDMPLSLQLDHINGNCKDNRIENLRILCPNCHSQTITYSGKNKVKKQKNFCKECKCELKRKNKKELCKTCFIRIEHIPRLKLINHNKRKISITKEELEKLIKQFPFTKIGEMLGVSDNAVRKKAISLGIILPKRRGEWTKTKEREQIFKLLSEGKNNEEISTLLNVTLDRVNNVLKLNNRKHSTYNYNVDKTKIIEMHNNGLSNQEISDILKCGKTTVFNTIKKFIGV